MKKILCISGSRADYGLLEFPVNVLKEAFDVDFIQLWAATPAAAFSLANDYLQDKKPDCLLILGDRWEILQAAIAAHLRRVPIAHLCGGDTTLGSYDDAMRDCISRLATWHFVTSAEAMCKVRELTGAFLDIYNVGNVALDYIMHGDWKRERPCEVPYVVVSYQPETIDGTNELDKALAAIGNRFAYIIKPNQDTGSDEISKAIHAFCTGGRGAPFDQIQHAEFLNTIFHCDEFIGNSSAMLYEAPALGVKCRMIGKRQQRRVAPTGDGKASERIREVLCRCL